jgi:hypothetical protein
LMAVAPDSAVVDDYPREQSYRLREFQLDGKIITEHECSHAPRTRYQNCCTSSHTSDTVGETSERLHIGGEKCVHSMAKEIRSGASVLHVDLSLGNACSTDIDTVPWLCKCFEGLRVRLIRVTGLLDRLWAYVPEVIKLLLPEIQRAYDQGAELMFSCHSGEYRSAALALAWLRHRYPLKIEADLLVILKGVRPNAFRRPEGKNHFLKQLRRCTSDEATMSAVSRTFPRQHATTRASGEPAHTFPDEGRFRSQGWCDVPPPSGSAAATSGTTGIMFAGTGASNGATHGRGVGSALQLAQDRFLADFAHRHSTVLLTPAHRSEVRSIFDQWHGRDQFELDSELVTWWDKMVDSDNRRKLLGDGK